MGNIIVISWLRHIPFDTLKPVIKDSKEYKKLMATGFYEEVQVTMRGK